MLTWVAPTTTTSPAEINGYRWTVTFKNFSYEPPKYCGLAARTEDVVSTTYFVANDHTYQHQIVNLRPASHYVVQLSASTESGFGNATDVTIRTLSSSNFPINAYKRTHGLLSAYSSTILIVFAFGVICVASSPVEHLNVISVQSNSVVLSWKYPCTPNGKIAFFHSTLVGERVGFHNHIFSVKYDISVRPIN